MSINFRRILSAESMQFELETLPVPSDLDPEEPFEIDGERNVSRVRESVLDELCGLLDAGGGVANRSRLYRDLLNREKRTGTALGEGIAVPHVRTIQAKRFTMAFGRSTGGLPFGAPDGGRVHLFFSMVSPPYEDRIYLKIYRSLAGALLQEELRQALLEAWTPNEIWKVLEVFR